MQPSNAAGCMWRAKRYGQDVRFGYREDEASVRGPYVPLRILPVTTAAFSAPLACKLCAEIPPARLSAGSNDSRVGPRVSWRQTGGELAGRYVSSKPRSNGLDQSDK